MNGSLKLGAILFLITSVCVGSLGMINSTTTPIIKTNKENNEKIAMQEIIKEADDFAEITLTETTTVKKLYVAKTGGENIGFIAKVESNGYGGPIEILIGLDDQIQVKGIQILSHAETPGLGANATKESFINQFTNKVGPLNVVKSASQSSDEIVAITGATITSAAVTEGVNEAINYVAEHQEDLLKEVN